MKRIAVAAALAGVVLAAAAFAPIAAADDPPVTVPTPTTPAPNPDPAPPKAQPKPKASKPASHTTPPRQTPTPVSTPRTYTPPATPAHSSSRVAPVAHPKQVKKRRAARKPKPARTHAVRPVPKPAPVVVHPQRRSSEAAPAGVSKGDHDWVGWVLLLVAATGLMMVSLGSMVGAARNPVGARVGALGLRWPRRERIREVVAEPIEQPLTAAAATVALPAPPRVSPAPQPPAPDPVVEPQPEVAVVAAPPVAARVAEPPLPPVEQEVVAEPTEELCEIFVWRGYLKARFYARLDLDETDEFAVAESPSFRFHGNGTPDNTEPARAAHRSLVEKLRGKGWEQEETTGPWYAARFRRPLGRTAS